MFVGEGGITLPTTDLGKELSEENASNDRQDLLPPVPAILLVHRLAAPCQFGMKGYREDCGQIADHL